jgi:selenocysteine-specific elongation factor
VDELIAHAVEQGTVERAGTALRAPGFAPDTGGREDAERLVAAVRAGEPTPPTVRELVAAGFKPDLIRAVCADGRLVRIGTDLVLTTAFLERAREVVATLGRPPGLTVSAFREALGTSRRYAVPLLEHFDATGVTRRVGDARVLRG